MPNKPNAAAIAAVVNNLIMDNDLARIELEFDAESQTIIAMWYDATPPHGPSMGYLDFDGVWIDPHTRERLVD